MHNRERSAKEIERYCSILIWRLLRSWNSTYGFVIATPQVHESRLNEQISKLIDSQVREVLPVRYSFQDTV